MLLGKQRRYSGAAGAGLSSQAADRRPATDAGIAGQGASNTADSMSRSRCQTATRLRLQRRGAGGKMPFFLPQDSRLIARADYSTSGSPVFQRDAASLIVPTDRAHFSAGTSDAPLLQRRPTLSHEISKIGKDGQHCLSPAFRCWAVHGASAPHQKVGVAISALDPGLSVFDIDQLHSSMNCGLRRWLVQPFYDEITRRMTDR